MTFCKDCKYFGEAVTLTDDDYQEHPSEFHTCELIKHFENGFYSTGEENLPDKNEKAVVNDGSGYYAALRVREDFGCVEFEKK